MPTNVMNNPQMNQNVPICNNQGYKPYDGVSNYVQIEPRQTTVRTVAGRDGALSAIMAPNSSEIFVDETAPIFWYVKTDSAGFKNEVTPYDVNKGMLNLETNKSGVEDLLKKVLMKLEEFSNAKSDNANAKSKKSD